MPIRYDHDELQTALHTLRAHLADQKTRTGEEDDTGHDGVAEQVVSAIHDDDAGTVDTLGRMDDDADTTATADRVAEDEDDAAATRITGTDVPDRPAGHLTADTPPATGHHAPSGTAVSPGTRSAGTAPIPPAAQPAPTMGMAPSMAPAGMTPPASPAVGMGAANPMGATGWSPQMIHQYNQQQINAFNQAVMARQAAINQLNMQAQAQAMQQTGQNPTITADEVQAIIDDLVAEETNRIEPAEGDGGSGSIEGMTMPAADVDALDVSEVSLEKSPAGQLSKDQVYAIIDKACDLNGVSDDPTVRDMFRLCYYHMATHESGLNCNAANGWDVNARGAIQSDGFPAQSSRGMWQTIPETFAGNHVAGTSTSIYDPLASCAASIRYTMQRYGVDENGGGLQEFASRRGIDVTTGETTGGYLGY